MTNVLKHFSAHLFTCQAHFKRDNEVMIEISLTKRDIISKLHSFNKKIPVGQYKDVRSTQFRYDCRSDLD